MRFNGVHQITDLGGRMNEEDLSNNGDIKRLMITARQLHQWRTPRFLRGSPLQSDLPLPSCLVCRTLVAAVTEGLLCWSSSTHVSLVEDPGEDLRFLPFLCDVPIRSVRGPLLPVVILLLRPKL